MDKEKSLFFLSLLLLAIPLLGICVKEVSASKPMELRFSCYMPATDLWGQANKWWAEEVNKRTEGRIKITYYPGGSLTGAVDSLEAVSKGLVDIAVVCSGYVPKAFAITMAGELLYQTEDSEVQARALMELYRTFAPFREVLEVKNNVKAMWYGGTGSPVLAMAKKQVTKLEDMKGLRLRASGAGLTAAVKDWGAVPIVIPIGDVYVSLQKGMIEGTAGYPYSVHAALKLHEITKYFIATHAGCFTVTGTFFNLNVWKRIPSKDQKIIEEVSDATIDHFIALENKLNMEATKAYQDAGMKIYSLPAPETARWKARIVPEAWDKWVAEREKEGLPGKEVLERYQAAVKKFEGRTKYVNPWPRAE